MPRNPEESHEPIAPNPMYWQPADIISVLFVALKQTRREYAAFGKLSQETLRQVENAIEKAESLTAKAEI